MHRAYHSYNPVASKLLQKRWDDKYYNEHRQLVSNPSSSSFGFPYQREVFVNSTIYVVHRWFVVSGSFGKTNDQRHSSRNVHALAFEAQEATGKPSH